MTLTEVAQVLAQNRVPPGAYCLTGGLPNEAYTIEHDGGVWRVYYSERGCRIGLQEFGCEASACAAFLRTLLNDGVIGTLPDQVSRLTE